MAQASRAVEIRNCMLQVIAEMTPKSDIDASLQSGGVLSEVARRIGARHDTALEQAVLTAFHDLFRTGYLAWGLNIINPDPPFFHVTERARKSLATLSRDPSNPDGYLNHLSQNATLNVIAESYLQEALACFVNDLPKATAVMVGAASESMAVELRDAIVNRLGVLGRSVPKALNDWRVKIILDAMRDFFDQNAQQMSRELREPLESYWPAFMHQIRSARNDAGHPSSVDPVTIDTVHASLLFFPELAKYTRQLLHWIPTLK